MSGAGEGHYKKNEKYQQNVDQGRGVDLWSGSAHGGLPGGGRSELVTHHRMTSGYAGGRFTSLGRGTSQRQRHEEATAGAIHFGAAGLTAVAAGDLADQGEAEAGAGVGGDAAGGVVR